MFSPLAAAIKNQESQRRVTAFSPATSGASVQPNSQGNTYGIDYVVRSALSGGICCAITHGSLCPVDVVKTRMQLEPEKYNSGMIQGFRRVIQNEGWMALSTGLGPTVSGYFIQGWFKFGGVEFFKIRLVDYFGTEKAWDYRLPIYLAASAMAETIADIFLCPLEATRIKLVSNPSYAPGLLQAFPKIIADEGIMTGFYSGFVPMLFKQVPYTMAKFSVQGFAAEFIVNQTKIDLSTASDTTKLGISLSSGVIAGIAAAVISHPADTLLSVINKPGAGGEGNIVFRLGRVASEIGFVKLSTNGLGARCVMIGTLTAGQFGIFDSILEVFGVRKFQFIDPNQLK